MARERLSMRQLREILRQKLSEGLSHREVVRSLGVSYGTVAGAAARAKELGLEWAGIEGLGEEELEKLLYEAPSGGKLRRAPPDPAWIDLELRKAGVTLRVLHLEYLESHRDHGYRYSQFCERFRRWKKRHRLSMHQPHRAGEKLFVDYSGKTPRIVNPHTGEVREAELFVAVLGASNYTYVEATASQKVADWIGSHTRALEFLAGVPRLVVPDQLRTGVTAPCRYEPGLQRTYEEWAAHYGTTILPARAAHPRDKAKVEVGVQIAQRWILARLRNQTFFSLEELNTRIRELLEELNRRTMRLYGASRLELFERLDRPALRPLPVERFVFALWKFARVNIDYHVEVDHHFYSVPHALLHERLDVRLTGTTLEAFFRSRRVASHRRSFQRGGHTTRPEHMPKAHREHLEWSPSRLIAWATKIGPDTGRLVEAILQSRPHPEQGYRSCLGILRLERRYGAERLEAACSRAVAARARSYRHVDSILKSGLDRRPLPQERGETVGTMPREHEHLRGAGYYE